MFQRRLSTVENEKRKRQGVSFTALKKKKKNWPQPSKLFTFICNTQLSSSAGSASRKHLIGLGHFYLPNIKISVVYMDPEATQTARESLDLAFHMSNILDTGLDRHTLSVLIALCDFGLNPEALAAAVKELQREMLFSPPTPNGSSSSP